MAVLSIGQMWATDPTISWAFKTLATTSGTQDGITWETGKTGSATATACNSTNGLVLYGVATGGGYFQTTSAISGTITNVNIVSSNKKNTPKYTVYCSADGSNWTAIASNQTAGTKDHLVTGSYTYVKVSNTTGATAQLAVTSITVTYAGGSTPTLAVDPIDWNFGAVATDAAASKVFSVSGSNLEAGTLTLTVPSGYSVSPASITMASAGDLDATNVTVSKNTTTAGTYNGNLTISGCGLEDDVEVALAMEVKAKYTVTWNNNGSTSTTQVLEGNKPVFPATPESCDATSTTFIGWATAPWTGKLADLSEKTVYTKASDMPEVTANGTVYYAVFAKVAGQSGWIETAIGSLTSYDVFVFAGDMYAMTNNNGTGSAPATSAITVADGKITSEVADNLKWQVSGDATNGYSFSPNGTTNYLYCNTDASSSSNNNMRVGDGGLYDRILFEFDGDGYLVTKDDYTARYLSIYNNADFRGYVNTNSAIIPKFYKYFAGSVSDYMTTCCTKYDISIADGITNGSISADLAKACEGATVTITFSPEGGYHLKSWSVNGDDQDVNDNTFAMPAEDVEVSAVFEHDPCSNLLVPTLNGAVAVTYNSATINWNAAANASSYDVAVVRHSDSESIFSGNLNDLTKALAGLNPETQYDYSIMAVGDGVTYCTSGNGVLAGNFTTSSLPTAHLTLKDPSGTHASSGDYAILTPFNLPSTAAACSKAFVGWDANPDCATAPTYAKGAEFTFANTTDVTLHAVYADVTGGSTSTTNIAYTAGTTTNMTGGNDAATFGLNAADWSVV